MTRFDRVRERSPIRVLIVDDSALMRKLLADVLKSAPEIEIVGTARDGAEAVALSGQLKPDVITLDVEMPGLSGLEAIPLLQAVHDAAILMVSSFTQEGADVTLAALEAGAIDFFPKPDRHQITQLRESRDALVAKIFAAAQTRTKGPRIRSVPRPAPDSTPALQDHPPTFRATDPGAAWPLGGPIPTSTHRPPHSRPRGASWSGSRREGRRLLARSCRFWPHRSLPS